MLLLPTLRRSITAVAANAAATTARSRCCFCCCCCYSCQCCLNIHWMFVCTRIIVFIGRFCTTQKVLLIREKKNGRFAPAFCVNTAFSRIWLGSFHIVAMLLLLRPTLPRCVAASAAAAAAAAAAVAVAVAHAAAIFTECSYVLGSLFFLVVFVPKWSFRYLKKYFGHFPAAFCVRTAFFRFGLRSFHIAAMPLLLWWCCVIAVHHAGHLCLHIIVSPMKFHSFCGRGIPGYILFFLVFSYRCYAATTANAAGIHCCFCCC